MCFDTVDGKKSQMWLWSGKLETPALYTDWRQYYNSTIRGQCLFSVQLILPKNIFYFKYCELSALSAFLLTSKDNKLSEPVGGGYVNVIPQTRFLGGCFLQFNCYIFIFTLQKSSAVCRLNVNISKMLTGVALCSMEINESWTSCTKTCKWIN